MRRNPFRGGAGTPLTVRAEPWPRGRRTRPAFRRRVYLGHSVDGRRIYAVKLGDLDNPRSVLVVGDIHRFPYRWRPLGSPGDLQYSGPCPLSEPESRLAHSLILAARPQVTIWFHQPLGLVDRSGGSVSVERRFARLTRLPLHRLTRYPGSAAGRQDHRLSDTTAFVVELPPGSLSPAGVSRYAAAVRSLSRS